MGREKSGQHAAGVRRTIATHQHPKRQQRRQGCVGEQESAGDVPAVPHLTQREKDGAKATLNKSPQWRAP